MRAAGGEVLHEREREREGALLASALAAACDGGGALVVVEGAPGIGRRRLTHEGADR